MNPEGRKTFNSRLSIDQRIQEIYEAPETTSPSPSGNGQTQQTTSTPNQTEYQKKIALIKSQAKLNELKQKYPHIFPQGQTLNPPSASSHPSPR
ncbi:hypothetical protein NIES37_37960 [Tolypothrix tenuis PCC 7101]|uniref:Uncharacterized protein n=1 Tax=Tolypothrix tenuis PCC 7101 TaxID=231146 RepID=A0A1Z4N271_9CYAN|nr:hypothetical protein [Aulosira sp. FACHB-113]BAY99813.1 hypothetical protein NIES37_37960 [Tolypothrix tenuis PCC 7101]BAZ76265.1 hypothetical protein NIES50_48630 [Aulosira laxa NIES-50]